MRIEVNVCPECGAWSELTGNGFPLHSSCEHDGHPEALRVSFYAPFESRREAELVRAVHGGVHPNDEKPRANL